MIAFVHIPKTAGSTLAAMFRRAYGGERLHDAGNFLRGRDRSMAKVAGKRWEDKAVTIGHSPYAVFNEHLPRDTRYVTLLREPVDRVISHYRRHIHRPWLGPAARSQRTESGRATAASLEEALVDLRLPHLTNLATRLLCSDPSPMGDLHVSALDEAKANLRSFASVGITERFDESVVLLQRALGLRLVPYGENLRVSRPAATMDEITDEQRALIAEYNELDAELHRFARGLFQESAAAAGDRLAIDVQALRDMNEAAVVSDEAAIGYACAWLEHELPPGTTKPAAPLQTAALAAGISELALPGAYRRVGVWEELDPDTGELLLRRLEALSAD